MENLIKEILEEHLLIIIFLACFFTAIEVAVQVNGPYTSATYYPELVLSVIAIISVFFISFLIFILGHFYRN